MQNRYFKDKSVIHAFTAGVLVLSGCTTTAQAPATSNLSETDLAALTAAYQLVLFDLQECKLLPDDHVSTPQVKTISAKICADAAYFKPLLEQLATKYNVKLPDALSYELKAQYGSLFYRPWPNFDVNYLQDQISSHEQALAIFGQEIEDTKDPQVKAFAEQNVPVVRANLQLLRQALKEIDTK
jgi:putative membrane protein